MSKWYVKSNTVEKIVSIPHSSPMVAAIQVFNDTNEFDIFDEYFYVDERGFRDYKNADSLTQVIETPKVISRYHENERKKGLP
jgi:hypothetical protein